MAGSPQLLGAETTYRGWSTLFVTKILLPDGRTITREIEHHENAACVLAYDPDRKTAILVRQMRAAPLYAAQQAEMTEAIAGLIDAGETADICARREAQEEAGLRLNALEHVVTAWTHAGIVHRTSRPVPGSVHAGGPSPVRARRVDDESIEVVEIGLAALAAMADGQGTDRHEDALAAADPAAAQA